MLPVIAEHVSDRFEGRRVYEMSSYGATYDYLRKRCKDAEFSEYFHGRPLGATIDDIRNEDATRLTFDCESFDVVTSNQVFEHVADDIQAFRECHRVLKAGGALIFTVPLYDSLATQQVARLSVRGAIEWIGTPEYHDSRLAGPQSAPVYWRHSIADIGSRVAAAGFRSVRIVPVRFIDARQIVQQVIYAVKV
jgi:SAM-dependent methyltransferase